MTVAFTPEMIREFLAGKDAKKIYFYGYIKYRDIFGSVITFGHCWRYYEHLGRYLPEDNKAYNYRKVEPPSGA